MLEKQELEEVPNEERERERDREVEKQQSCEDG